jgi:hypothetical protein
MARKSDGEKLDDLMILAATLTERLDNVRRELKELKQQLEEASRRMWLLVPPIVAALLSAGLTALVTYLASRH